ncbi:MAG: hypothetical protein JW793_12030 [Acidobacteria bacterium]|nr:hypothetical protein [Acidobacteriota bacterium]
MALSITAETNARTRWKSAGIKEEQLVRFLEKRIEFYRRCMAWAFIMGLLAGVDIFCGERTFSLYKASGPEPVFTKFLLCFFIATAGIAAGFACRRRTGFLKGCLDKVSRDFGERHYNPKPAPGGIITEMQVLFGMMLVFSAGIAVTGYPVPVLPSFLDSDLLRIMLLSSFVGVCWLSVRPDRKNSPIRTRSLQNFLQRQKAPFSLGRRSEVNRAHAMKSPAMREARRLHTNRTIHP